LNSLKDARIVAGHKGLDRKVCGVTVMDAVKQPNLSEGFMRPWHLALASLPQIRDDIDAQCFLIRFLHRTDTSGLVVFTSHLTLPRIDDKLIITSNEINMPLIWVDRDKTNSVYAEIINDIVKLVYQEELNKGQLKSLVQSNLNRGSGYFAGNNNDSFCAAIINNDTKSVEILSGLLSIDLRKPYSFWLIETDADNDLTYELVEKINSYANEVSTSRLFGIYNGSLLILYDLFLDAENVKDYS